MHTPEIKDGTVEIMAVSREAGSRTKIAVWSKDENVDTSRRASDRRVPTSPPSFEELGGEKIDVIKYSETGGAGGGPFSGRGRPRSGGPDQRQNCKAIVPDSRL